VIYCYINNYVTILAIFGIVYIEVSNYSVLFINVNLSSNNSIEQCVVKYKQGDEQAFRELYDLLNNKLFAFVMSRTPSRPDALDILQEVFIDLWQALSKFSYKTDKQFYAFVFLITKRRVAKYYRGRKQTEEMTDQHIQDNYQTVVEYFPELSKATTKLKQKYQDVIHLRYWSELSFSEIADYLNINESAAKVRHHRALKQLQTKLKKYEE